MPGHRPWTGLAVHRRSRIREVNLQKLLIGSFFLLSAALLAGCGNEQGEGPMKPGIYVYEASDGSSHRMVFSEDGTYSDMEDNTPKPVEQGQWLRRDGQLCMKSANTGAELCLEEEAGEDGSFSLSRNGTATHFTLEASARSR